MNYRYVALRDYWMGRDTAYAEDWTFQIARNGQEWVETANEVLELAASHGIGPHLGTQWGYIVSGWRPKAVNEKTSNAGKFSPHILALAGDLGDWPDRRFARWCLQNLDVLETHGIYMEDPRWTPTWVHWQIRPPASGRHVFIPSSAPALALALPEQQIGANA